MKNLGVKNIFKSFFDMIVKFRLTLFIVVMVGGLAIAVLMLDKILQNPSASTNSSNNSVDTTTFDQATIDRLKQLHSSSDGTGTFSLPSGRVNPFSE